MTATTLRLNMPQWQGGNEPAYHFGARLLQFLAPPHRGPEETVPVDDPATAAPLENEGGIVARAALLRQARAARAAIDRHRPDRIVTLGGDCLVDLAPMAYLNERYGAGFGVLWIDAHPDVIGPRWFAHAHAHVLGALLGEGDPDLDALVARRIDPARVIYAGLQAWSAPEGEIIARLGLRHVPAAALTADSRPVLDWIAAQGIRHLAVHFDLDVLDPAHFSPLLLNRPDAPAGAWDGVPRGQMELDQVVRLLSDVAGACDIVGLAIAEHLPWDMIRLRNALRQLPLLAG